MYTTTVSLGLFLITFFNCVYAQELHIRGSSLSQPDSHHQYLGCMNCDSYNSNSIWNSYGNYGNNYSNLSIWNDYGTYGDSYSDYSPWNSYANYPPVIVDKQGNFYGYFTLNRYKRGCAEFRLAKVLYENYSLVSQDVGSWYTQIFMR